MATKAPGGSLFVARGSRREMLSFDGKIEKLKISALALAAAQASGLASSSAFELRHKGKLLLSTDDRKCRDFGIQDGDTLDLTEIVPAAPWVAFVEEQPLFVPLVQPSVPTPPRRRASPREL